MSTASVEDLPDLLPRLWAFSLRLCGNERDAEQVLERASLQCIEHAPSSKPGTSLLNLMFSIICGIWISKPKVRDPGCDTDIEQDTGGVESEIVAAVANLPDESRVVMLLVEVEGLSHVDVAEILGVSIELVTRCLSRARQMIGADRLAGPRACPTGPGEQAYACRTSA
ncbi:RNA polymerase sigma factor [Burkholderia gladioli]|uniref:RNA polymerase sigma factor n=1 Tax=Burkholderia gladioli TaxID=28095 RepID=UPI001CC3E423|nr:sigma-70 family RNA polymerase sigma factor [Burkholderia gladioli]